MVEAPKGVERARTGAVRPPGDPRGEGAARTRDERTEELFAKVTTLTDARAQRACLDDIVLLNAPVAAAIAHRYHSRGVESDDLEQVAYLGLVKAAQRYRPGAGRGFLAYAVPTISGEIKRHFRDYGWMVRPPRRIQELRSAATATSAVLHQERGRPPTAREIAHDLGVDVTELAEASLARGCFTALSLDEPTREGTQVLGDVLVDETDPFAHIDNVEALRGALGALSDRDRTVLLLRFSRGMTQEQIGQEIGVSQMQVSRILSRILGDLREQFDDAPAPSAASA